MKCPMETRETERLLALAAGRLEARQAAAFQVHLEGCPACRRFVAEQRAVWNVLDVFEAAPVSPDFDRRLYQRIENDGSWIGRLIRPVRPLLAGRGLPVAAAVLVTLFAGVLLREAEPPAGRISEFPQIETVAPDQAESALEQMEMVRQFSQLVQPEPAPPTI